MTTIELLSEGPHEDGARPGPYLVLGLECARPLAGSARYSLVGVEEVRVGRGEERRARRVGRRLDIEIPDTSLSSLHLRLIVGSEGWVLEDAGSKNGSFVNGARTVRRALTDGDVIDAARTILVFGSPGGTADAGDLELGVDGTALDTLDPVLAAKFATLTRVATSSVSVLLLGETGTGKELAARAVHDASARRGPYVPINCGALPPTLVESELFGHRKGAFSGATADRPGVIRAADRGTLFLDEIAELGAPARAALLRVLQEREVMPVGADSAVKVDVRFISATCRDLPALVELDRFRRDLYARIAGFTLTLPTLTRRRADLGLLLARRLKAHAGGGERRLERGAARLLFLHDWPQNVRELDHALATALSITEGDLGAGQVREALQSRPAAIPPATSGPVDQEQLVALLRAHRGNVSYVALALGTSRSHVRRLAARFGLILDRYRD